MVADRRATLTVAGASLRTVDVREIQVTVDCADPAALATFWCEVLGYELPPPPPGFGSWDEAIEAWGLPAEQRNSRAAAEPPEGRTGPRLFFQRVPEGKTAKNRMHLDVRAAPGLEGDQRMAALDAEADRLCVLGASRLDRLEPDGLMEKGFIVMQDPEGNEFCLD
jgi:catechol 2,3-dioxygenase-like lactoylglutathione lyase family enzyme